MSAMNSKTQLKRGDVVMIYQDPATQLQPEGRAKLLKCVREDDGQPRWRVQFLSDGATVERWIAV